MTAQIIEFAPRRARVQAARDAARRGDARAAEIAEQIARVDLQIRYLEKALDGVDREIARGTWDRGPRKGLPFSEKNLKDLERSRRDVLGWLAEDRERLADLLAEMKALP